MSALPWMAANPAARWRRLGISVLVLTLTAAGGAWAQSPTPPRDLAALVDEAATRFALPPSWITGVMRRESAFQTMAVSSAGAVGLMQVLPSTYRGLRLRYGLAPDPTAPRDNVLAGAAYLRELYDRFGADGFLAAYNAGPDRYLKSVMGEAALPTETRRYVAQLQLDLGLARAPTTGAASSPSLFAPLDAQGDDTRSASGLAPDVRTASGLFAPISGESGEAGRGR